MYSKTCKFIARLFFIFISGFFAFHLFTQFGNSLNNIIYDLTENYYHIYLRFDTRETVIFYFFIFWLAAYFVLEFSAFFSKGFKFKRLLTNFRYAPIAAFISSIFIIAAFDLTMIEYSKWEIRNYIYSSSQNVEKPDFKLFNNYRHWCGNGAVAQENYLYFDTAAEGINDENPYVRSRSLLMAADVQNWLNGGDVRFDRFIEQSCQDSNQIVRKTVESLLKDSTKSCENLISSK